MPFKYVLVPATANDAMQELEYPEDIVDLTNDTFRSFVEKYFANKGETVDRDVLLAQLQERTGVNMKEKVGSGEIQPEAMEKMLSLTSVEIFPVQLPVKEFGFHGVSVYLDDKGVSKDLELNNRVSGLVQACGYPGQTFRGDCFVGRIFDDTEDEWRRMSFTLEDCSTDALWVSQVKQQRANRSSSDMTSLAGKIGAKNPAHLMMGDDAAPKGETEEYKWRQEDDEVEVTFKKEGLQKSDVKLVKVTFQRQRLKVDVKGEVLVDANLFGITTPDECTWTVSDGVLQVTLVKASSDRWDKLLKE